MANVKLTWQDNATNETELRETAMPVALGLPGRQEPILLLTELRPTL